MVSEVPHLLASSPEQALQPATEVCDGQPSLEAPPEASHSSEFEELHRPTAISVSLLPEVAPLHSGPPPRQWKSIDFELSPETLVSVVRGAVKQDCSKTQYLRSLILKASRNDRSLE